MLPQVGSGAAAAAPQQKPTPSAQIKLLQKLGYGKRPIPPPNQLAPIPPPPPRVPPAAQHGVGRVARPPTKDVQHPMEKRQRPEQDEDDEQEDDVDLKRFAADMRPVGPNPLPPAVGVLQYGASFEDVAVYYRPTLEIIADRPDLTFPSVPLMTRATLMQFMREPDPRAPWERPCINLDRISTSHEHVRCIAHVLSERVFGEGRGFRLRELLFNNVSVKIAAAVECGTNPCVHLEIVPNMCYMCYVWMTTQKALDQKNKLLVGGGPQGAQAVTLLNDFTVDIDKPGEYDRRAMIPSEDVGAGIWGPFPLWNERNYVARAEVTEYIALGGGRPLRGFAERETLLFQPARVPLPRIASESANDSTPSAPTTATPAVSTFRR